MSVAQSISYRELWEQVNGTIPKDENGISFEIHHINGDHFDDRIENLMCVSIQEHYDIHRSQGDMIACCAILKRMNRKATFTDEERERLAQQAKEAAIKRVENGTHNFLGGQIQKEHQKRRKEEGTHNFVGKSNPNYVQLEDGSYTTIINCVDLQGNNVRVMKSEYENQTGDKSTWKYVVRNSNEGRRRVALR